MENVRLAALSVANLVYWGRAKFLVRYLLVKGSLQKTNGVVDNQLS